MTGGRHRGEVPEIVDRPRWDEAAEMQAFRAWFATLPPGERNARAVYAYMVARLKAFDAGWKDYHQVVVREHMREASWLRDVARRGVRD